jgi:hypothetical protein
MRQKIDWNKHFKAQKSSELNVLDYCKQNGLNHSSWYQRIRLDKIKNSSFTDVKIKTPAKKKSLSFKVSLIDESNIEFEGSTNDSGLLGLIFGKRIL